MAFADAVGLDGRECVRAYVEAFEPPPTDPVIARYPARKAPPRASPRSRRRWGATAVPVVTSASDVAAIDAPGLVRVRVTASAECWISAVADGVRVWHGRLRPGDDVEVEAQTLLTLRVGDAGAVTYTIDGAPAKALGAPGQPATVVLTPETSERFLLNNPSSAL